MFTALAISRCIEHRTGWSTKNHPPPDELRDALHRVTARAEQPSVRGIINSSVTEVPDRVSADMASLRLAGGLRMAIPMDAADVIRLVAAAQEGAADETRRLAEARMVELAGSVEAGPAGLHFVRAVALRVNEAYREALAASTLMLAAADREDDPGWRSIALSLRARLRLMLGDSGLDEYDIDAVLQDLAGAEAAVAAGTGDLLVGSNAHIGIGNGYSMLRLHELADPHYTTAYELALRADPASPVPAICQTNLAEMHLEWALELYRVGDAAEAEKHSLIAESHALLADRTAPPGNAYRRNLAGLLAGCARADGDDPAGAAAQIRTYAEPVKANEGLDWWLFSMPFLAVALARSGHRDEALAVIEQARAECPPDAEWVTVAALTHTHAVLLAQSGPPELRAVLRYGDGLAGVLWRQRQRTLHTAETMRSYERLRAEHEQVSHSADTDALTGIPNRRAFDRELVRRNNGGTGDVAVLVIDLDKFKPLNDVHGHAAGDDALKAIAGALISQIRTGDLVARTGGDEFCALLDAGLDGAAQVAERMVHAVRDLALPVAVSIGVAAGPQRRIQDVLHRADQAMYAAKAAGGDRAHAESHHP